MRFYQTIVGFGAKKKYFTNSCNTCDFYVGQKRSRVRKEWGARPSALRLASGEILNPNSSCHGLSLLEVQGKALFEDMLD